LLKHIGVFIGYFVFYLWRKTLRIVYKNPEHLEQAYQKNKGIIYSIWHGDLFVVGCAGMKENKRRKIYILTSKSRDGELISRFLHKLGYGTVRGSSYRGGIGGFLSLHTNLKAGSNTALALDGSRGPRYEVKPGSILLAKTTGAILLPSAVHCSSKIRLNSWDRCEIPLPFSKCIINIGKPMEIPETINREELEQYRKSVEDCLRKLKGVEEK